MEPFGVTIVPLSAYSSHEPEETGATFKENALLKARNGLALTGRPCLGDDSGLAIPFLGGAPGLHSKRWMGPEEDYDRAMDKLYHAALLKADGHTIDAEFICVMALVTPEGKHSIFEGVIKGTLVWPPRGTNLFGYDRFFKPAGFSETFGEMPLEEKNAMSHRAIAMKKFIAFMRQHIHLSLPTVQCSL